MFGHVIESIGLPDRPLEDVDLGQVRLAPAEGFLKEKTEMTIKLLKGKCERLLYYYISVSKLSKHH